METICLLTKNFDNLDKINSILPKNNYYQISLQENTLNKLQYLLYKDSTNYKFGIVSGNDAYGWQINGYPIYQPWKNTIKGHYFDKLFYCCIFYDENGNDNTPILKRVIKEYL